MGIVIVIAMLELVIIGILTFFLVMGKRSMDKIITNAHQIARKNVDIEDVKLTKGPKDMIALANSLNIIKSNIRGFIEATKGNVITISDAITLLSDAARQNEVGSEQTANSIQIVAQKTSEQLDLVRDNLRLIESNNGQLGGINDFIDLIRSALDDSVESCQNGMSSLEIYERDMNKIAENLRRSTDILVEFNNQITEINSIKELVVDISEQLRLLAFNASIEAARAGEAGKIGDFNEDVEQLTYPQQVKKLQRLHQKDLRQPLEQLMI